MSNNVSTKPAPQVTVTPGPNSNPKFNLQSFLSGVGDFFSDFGGPIVNGLFGIGQSLMNNHFANKAAQEQYDRQVEFWNMQNAYNNPIAQRQRLASAGINPSSVSGDIAQGNTAGELSSVPGNEYAQNGMLRLDALAQTLETFSRIENIGSETDLNTAMLTSELLRQTLIGLGIDEKRVDILIKDWEAKKSEVEFSQLGRFFEHRNTMYDLDEAYRAVEIEHEKSLKALADAHTDESRASARLKAVETGLTAMKIETEKSIKALNESNILRNVAETGKTSAETRKIKYDTFRTRLFTPLQYKAQQLANDLNATEAERAEINRIIENAEKQLLVNDDGTPSDLNILDHTLSAIGEVFGFHLGVGLGGNSSPSIGSSVGSGLFAPSTLKIGQQIWKAL